MLVALAVNVAHWARETAQCRVRRQVPGDAQMMDMVFADGGDAAAGFVDNNKGLDYHVPVGCRCGYVESLSFVAHYIAMYHPKLDDGATRSYGRTYYIWVGAGKYPAHITVRGLNLTLGSRWRGPACPRGA